MFGTAIHHAAELYNQTGDITKAQALFAKEWAKADPDYWPKQTDYAGLRRRGKDILEALENHYRAQDRRVIGTEIPFLVPFGEHELHGYVDLVETQRSGTGHEVIKIVDYKTNSSNPTRYELALDVQFTVYHYAVSRKEFWCGMPGNPEFPGVENGEWLWATVAQDVPKRCIWFSLWTGKQLDAGPRTLVDYGRLYRVCDEILKANEHQVYVPKVGSACTYCDYTEQCVMDIPVTLAAFDDKDDPTRWI